MSTEITFVQPIPAIDEPALASNFADSADNFELTPVAFEICRFVNDNNGSAVIYGKGVTKRISCSVQTLCYSLKVLLERRILIKKGQRTNSKGKPSPIVSLVVPFEKLTRKEKYDGNNNPGAVRPSLSERDAVKAEPGLNVEPGFIDQLTAALQERLELRQKCRSLEEELVVLWPKVKLLQEQLDDMKAMNERLRNNIDKMNAATIKREALLASLLRPAAKVQVDGRSGTVISVS